MSAQDHFRAGELTAAIEAQIASVKRNPGDPDERFFLVGLLSFGGQPDRAATHLDVLCELDKEFVPLAVLYRSLLQAEEERRRVHAGGHRPGLPEQAGQETDQRLELVGALAAGDSGKAGDLVARLGGAASQSGQVNGLPFTAFANTDDVLGPTIEVFADGRCLWMPLASIRRLETKEPKTILDLLWLEAQLEDASGLESVVHLPVRYAGSELHADDLVRLGRLTEWDEAVGAVQRGLGQNTFAFRTPSGETEEIALLEIRKLEVAAQ